MKTLLLVCAVCCGAFLECEAQAQVAKSASESGETAVYVKIILPMARPKDDHQVVESWIRKELVAAKRGNEFRAVTNWVRMPEKEYDFAEVWDAVIDKKHWGCPVTATAMLRAKGKIQVKLTGWTPFSLEQTGMSVADEIGSRSIGIIGQGRAYVAIIVVPRKHVPRR